MNSLQSIRGEGKLKISTRIKGAVVEIDVEDNGVGISKEHMDKIFDPFFTTKEPGKGVGLGLSIVYKIISEHHGTIHHVSENNKGTKVHITLPVQASSTL